MRQPSTLQAYALWQMTWQLDYLYLMTEHRAEGMAFVMANETAQDMPGDISIDMTEDMAGGTA